MTFIQLDQTIQYLAWFLSLAAVIHGLYILLLNSKHSANRHVCTLLLLIAINSLASGLLIGVSDLLGATLPAQMIAVTLPAIQPLLLVTTVAMLKPAWLSGRKRAIFIPIYLLIITPLLLTYADVRFGTSLWFTNLASQAFLPGLEDFVSYSSGNLAPIFRYVFFIITPALLISSLVYATFHKKSAAEDKRLAGFLLIGNLISIFLLLGLSNVLYPSLALLVANAIYILVYFIATFQQMLSGRRMQTGSIQKRMTGVILVTVIPILFAMVIFMTVRAQQLLEEKAISGLRNTSRTLSATTSLWLDQNAKVIRALASQPAIQSMDPDRQTPILLAMATEYPEMHLISTTDLEGVNVSRSDGATPVDYSDRGWFQEAASGAPLVMQTVIDQVNGQPSLVLAAPIKDTHDDILGVVMLATDMELFKSLLTTGIAGEGQFIYVINENNQAIIHPNPDFTAHLFDLSQYPPVTAIREGETGTIRFEDKYGRAWRAVGAILENDWAVFTQVREAQLVSQALSFQRVSWIAFSIGIGFLILMSSLAIRQTIRPIHTLTATVTAIAAGDLTQVAPVETEDEIGLLARTFNSMTSQIRDLISGLERRVSERTRDLEKRAVQLQVTADVAREAAEIRDLEQLLDHSVCLISKRFSFYHAGIFLVDENQEYAVLRAASSEGGKRMLARGHKLKIGQEGIVGFVAAEGEPRIALDVGSDAIFFNNPDLPQTRSEIALPLMVREFPTGVLDVQSTKASAFTEEDIAILQILADQIALAIDNTRLLQESQQSLDELQNLYSTNVIEAWHKHLANKTIGYTYNRLGVDPLESPSGMADQPEKTGSGTTHGHPLNEVDPYLLHVPLTLRGQVLGYLQLKRGSGQSAWTPEEMETVSSIVIQLGLALENARLLAEIRQHARNEQLIGHIASQVQSSLDIETVMKRTVMEIGQAFRANRVRIQLGNGDSPSNGHNSPDEDLPWS